MNGDPRFVILTHDHPFLHWDLMLEERDALTTYRLLEEPAVGVEIAAEPLAAHRKAYLDYEGPVSGDRGTVTRWDHGTYRELRRADDEHCVQLSGTRLVATLTLRREQQRWTYRIDADEPSSAAPSNR